MSCYVGDKYPRILGKKVVVVNSNSEGGRYYSLKGLYYQTGFRPGLLRSNNARIGG